MKTVPLPLAKKLQEAFPDWVTEKYWIKYELLPKPVLLRLPKGMQLAEFHTLSGKEEWRVIAPDTDELLEKLPKPELWSDGKGTWYAEHSGNDVDFEGSKIGLCETADTPAEALGELLLKLHGEGLL